MDFEEKLPVVDNNCNEPSGSYDLNRDFASLKCWQEACALKIFLYKKVIPVLPEYEKGNLISQIRRASISITANIAEGYGRYHYQEGIQFYRISRASVNELKDHLISCYKFDYIDAEHYRLGIQYIESVKIKINGYIRYVQRLKRETK